MIRTRLIKNKLPEIRKNAPAQLQQIHEDTAKVIESMQKQLVPVDTGALRGTIRIQKDGKRIAVIEGTDSINYGYWIEYGSEGRVAQPHARPAAVEGRKYRDRRIKELAQNLGK